MFSGIVPDQKEAKVSLEAGRKLSLDRDICRCHGISAAKKVTVRKVAAAHPLGLLRRFQRVVAIKQVEGMIVLGLVRIERASAMPAVNPQSNPEVWWQRMTEKSAPVKKSVANAMWFVITEDNTSGGLRVATSPTARHTHFEKFSLLDNEKTKAGSIEPEIRLSIRIKDWDSIGENQRSER